MSVDFNQPYDEVKARMDPEYSFEWSKHNYREEVKALHSFIVSHIENGYLGAAKFVAILSRQEKIIASRLADVQTDIARVSALKNKEWV